MERSMNLHIIITSSVQFSRLGRLTLWDPMDWSMPGFPTPSPGAYSNACPLSHWCHLILSHPILLLPSIFSSVRVFSKSQFLASGGQSNGPGKIVQDSEKDIAMYNKTIYILILKSLFFYNHKFISVQSLTQLQLFATPWTAAGQASPSFTISQSLLKLMSIESMVLTHYLILCHCLLPLPSIFPSSRVFSNESALQIRWPNYWSFCISVSNQY